MGLFRLIGKLLKILAKRIVELLIISIVIIFMPALPPFGEYTAYSVTPALPLEGALSLNNRLANPEILFKNEVYGPEAFAHYNGELYTSVHGGFIVKVTNNRLIPVVNFRSDKCKEEFYQEIYCGRPLGMAFTKTGDLIVAEAYSGIWKVDVRTGKKTLLVSVNKEIDGRKPRLPNSVAVTSNGDIFWTDSSSEYVLRDGIYILLADGTGRLIRYSSTTKQNKVLIDKLHFANGVHLSQNEDFVIVNDLMKSRLLKYHLKGPKQGQHEVFVDGLPGLPDNIGSNGQGGFLVSLVISKDSSHPCLPQVIGPFPLIRKLVARMIGLVDFMFGYINGFYPNYISDLMTHYVGHLEPISLFSPKRVTIIEISEDGKIISSLHNTDSSISGISEAHIFEQYLYLGSPFNKYIARVKLADAKLKQIDYENEIPLLEVPIGTPKLTTTIPKPTTTTPKPTTTTTTSKPTTTTPKPTTTTTSKPTTTTTPKPTTTAPKPTTTTTPKPTTTTPKPTTTTPKPTTTTPKPTTTTPKPTTTTPKPTTTSPKPSTIKPTSKQPVVNEKKPSEVPKPASSKTETKPHTTGNMNQAEGN